MENILFNQSFTMFRITKCSFQVPSPHAGDERRVHLYLLCQGTHDFKVTRLVEIASSDGRPLI